MNKIFKRTISALLSGILLAGTICFAADEPLPEGVDAPYGLGLNMLPDSSFTKGNTATWNFAGGSGGLAVVDFPLDDPERGGYARLKIVDDGQKINSFQPLMQTISGTFVQDETYVFSAYIKADKIDKYTIGRVWLRILSVNENVAYDEFKIEVPGDGQWHYYALAFKIKKSVDKAKLLHHWGGMANANFELCFDDSQLRPIRTEPPLTLPELSATKKVSFTDIRGHWAENEIKEMAAMGIINGRDAKTFDPEAPVTRAEIAALLVRAIGYRTPKTQNLFRDVSRTDWFAKDLDTLAEVDIIDSNMLWQGNYYGNSELKREELAMFLSNSYDKMKSVAANKIDIIHFEDRKEISDWAIPYVMNCTYHDLMEGVEWNYFAPQGTVTRAQAATAIYRLRNILEAELS